MRGRIARLQNTYGFIAAADGRQFFFLPTAVAAGRFEDLSEGAAVAFEPTVHDRGLRASAVRPDDEGR